MRYEFPTDPSASRRAAVSTGLSFALFSCALGVYVPFFPVWLAHRGIDVQTIGVLLSMATVLRVLVSAPIVRIGDGPLGTRRLFVVLSSGAALCFAIFYFTSGVWQIAALLVIVSVLVSPAMPLLDVVVMQGVTRYGHDYGRIRLWGSVGWLFANIFGGLSLTLLPTEAIPAVVAAILSGSVFAGFFLDRGSSSPRISGTQEEVRKEWLPFVLFLAGIAALQGSHGFLMGFSSLMWKDMGFSEAMIGGFWSIGTIGEILLFFVAGHLLKRFSPLTLILAGAAGGIVRWVGLGLAPTFVPIILGLQFLHVMSFAIVHIATMAWLGSFATGRARRQGIVASAIAGVTAVMTVLSGYLYAHIGAGGFFAMAAISVIGMVLVLMARGELDRVNVQQS